MLYSYQLETNLQTINGIIDVSRHHWMPEQRIKEYVGRTENIAEDWLDNLEIKPVPQI